MNKDQINALIRELRKEAENLTPGKKRDVNNKLNRIYNHLRNNTATEDEAVEYDRQKMIVYRYLMAGHTITSLEAIEKFGITRLSAVIFNIEKMSGKAPNRRMIPVINRYGKTVRVAEYWIEQEGN